jgi:murein DD-endopeptidase MepM/ murein hydrolase activator NlpD
MSSIATTRILYAPDNQDIEGRRPWSWPLARIDTLSPCILPSSPDAKIARIGYQNAAPFHDPVPVLATQDGAVVFAAQTARCAMVRVDHPGGWSTWYEGLARLSVLRTDGFNYRRNARISAGTVLGYLDRTRPCLRFAITRITDDGFEAVAPGDHVNTWHVLPRPRSARASRTQIAA